MQVHPDIAALRSDRAPQRQAQAAMLYAREAWAKDKRAASMLRELEGFGRGAPLEDCPVLEEMFTGAGEAERLTNLLSRHYCAALATYPIGHPPFRNGFDGESSSILLARSDRAQLMLQAREPGETTHPGYIFTDACRFDAVLAGTAQARIIRNIGERSPSATFDFESITMQPGDRFAFDLSSEALAIDRVERRFVVLRLMRVAKQPQPGREFCAQSGRLMHQSAGSIATSRQEAIVALLGRMDRQDAVPEIARIASGEGDISLRWQSLREALALNSAAGFRALCEIARRSDDPLAAQAGALRAQLLETYPQLAQVENA